MAANINGKNLKQKANEETGEERKKNGTPGVRWDDKRGKFFIDYYQNGRRHREWGIRSRPFKSQREAADALASRRASILEDRYDWKPREKSPSFDGLLNWYLQIYSPEKRSHKRDLTSAKSIRAYFGSRQIIEIAPDDVQGYKIKRRQTLSRKTKQRISEATVDLELNLLKAVFSRAVEAGKAKTNPVKKVKLYRPDNRRSSILTQPVRQKLYQELRPHVRPVVRVLLETGLRVGEVMALRKENVQFKDGGAILRVRRKGGDLQEIPISTDLTNLLYHVVKSLPSSEGSGAPLWRKPGGKPLKNFRTAWENACNRAGVEGLWIHDLRRTFGTLALEDGADLVTLREILGHNHVSTTERYLCPEVKRQREAVEAVGARLMGSGWAADTTEVEVDNGTKLLEDKARAGVAE